MRKRYTDEAKAEAIELATTVGRPEAARRTGIPAGTIGSWLTRAGLSNADPEGRRERIRVAHETWLQRRVELGNEMGVVAALALSEIPDRIARGDELAAQRLASTMSALVDKAQLLSGDATERIEQLGGGSAVETVRVLITDVRERRHLQVVS